MTEKSNLIIKIIKVIDDYKVVINKGSLDGIKYGQSFLIYKEDEELFDPDTKESLGFLEIVKGKGKIVHLQPKISTIESTSKKIIKTNRGIMFGGTVVTEEDLPFDNVEVNDLVKPI